MEKGGTAPALSVKIERGSRGAGQAVVIIGKAVEPSAVKRNLARRRIRAIARERFGLRAMPRMVVILRRGARSLPFGKLRDEFNRSIAGIIPRNHQ